jgi:hypothetical protein
MSDFGSKDVEFASENGCIVRCRHETDDTWPAKLCATRCFMSSISSLTRVMATFSKTVREWNLDQYLDCYLPLLAAIAGSLNSTLGGFPCAVSANRKAWRPADVEMAAYEWWSRNGPR